MHEPRDMAEEIERSPALPPGDEERFVGYGVTGVPFASGHYLALRCFPGSSVGPGYRSVWHRDPTGLWTIFSDVAPNLGCARYFGAALERTDTTPIDIFWSGARTLTVTIPELINWELELTSTLATRLQASLVPQRHRGGRVLDARAWLASQAPGVGRVTLRGTVPNGQSFEFYPRRSWIVGSSRATIRGEDAGPPAPLPRQERLGSYWMPQRGHFVIGEAFFEASGALPDTSRQAASVHALGDAFVEALARKDFSGVAACFAADAHLRALVPPGVRDATTRAGATSYLESWFGGADRLELLHASASTLADRLHLTYRFRVHAADGPRIVEQHAYCEVRNGAIQQMDLLCSGFRRAVSHTPQQTAGIGTRVAASTDVQPSAAA